MSSVAGDAELVRPRNSQTFKPVLILTALGIVYGDIGTSPLYVFQAIAQTQGGRLDAASALGSLSLIVWTLIIIVTIKYSFVVMRADNHGEGGILALMSLTRASWRGRNRYLIVCGLIGAALLYGDGMITPAISVLSAVEGLKRREPRVRALHDADRRRRVAAAVCGAALRHRRRRPRVRSADVALVRLSLRCLD